MATTEERNNLGIVYTQSFDKISTIRAECKTASERLDAFEAMLDGVTNIERIAVLYAFMAFVAGTPPVEPDKEETNEQETKT